MPEEETFPIPPKHIDVTRESYIHKSGGVRVFSCPTFPLFVHHPTVWGRSTCHQLPMFLQVLWDNHLRLALDLQNVVLNSDTTIRDHLAFDGTQTLLPQVTKDTRTQPLTVLSCGRVCRSCSIIRLHLEHQQSPWELVSHHLLPHEIFFIV